MKPERQAKKETVEESRCSKCDRHLGLACGILPFVLDGTTYCPRCFVHSIAPTMPERYYVQSMSVTFCSRCKLETVNPGHGCCGNCRWKGAVHIAPAAA
jgi:hypothetical protein